MFVLLALTGEDSMEQVHDEGKVKGGGVVCGGLTFFTRVDIKELSSKFAGLSSSFCQIAE